MGRTTAFIALGANLGDRRANIGRAVELLGESNGVSVAGLSRMIETSPLAGMDQLDYIDAVVRVETELGAADLFTAMTSIEDTMGRVRGRKWQERTIDLDLLLYGDEIIETATLTVPHSQMHLRSFVLEGMCELDSDMIHPVLNRSMKTLAERLNVENFFLSGDRPQLISVAGVMGVGKSTLANGLADVFNCRMTAEAYDKNPYMADVYAGRNDLALDSQLYFLNSRVEQLRVDKLSPGEPVITDYVFDKEMIFAAETLSAEQLGRYKKQHDDVVDVVTKPVATVYLHDTPDACMERINARQRPYEQQIAVDVIRGFCEAYDRLFSDWKQSPLIRLDAGRFNCLDPDHVSAFADELRHYIWK